MKTKTLIYIFLFVFIQGFMPIIKSQTFVNYTTNNGLPDDFVTGIAIDTNNNKWVSTANGVAMYDDNSWTTFTSTDGLIENYSLCIAVDKSNNVWVGSNNGVSKYNGTTWSTFTTTQGLIDNSVNYIYGAPDGSVWFATAIGVSKYNQGVFTNYSTTDGLSSNVIKFITSENNGNVWFCTEMGGVSKFNGTTFTNYMTSNVDSLLDDNTFAIAFDNNNNRYIGTFYGITKLNNSDSWSANYRMQDGLYNDFVRDIKADHDGNLWIGFFADYNFDGGISFYNGNEWFSFSTPQGLVNTQVTSIAIDKFNKPWVATGGGVSKFDANIGIAENKSIMNVNIYPNPAQNVIHIDGEVANSQINILDMSGREIYTSYLLENNNQLNIEKLSAGIYFVQIFNDKNLITKKIIVP